MTDPSPIIRPDMTVLDVVSRYRETEKIFKAYDDVAGECICCQALFEPLKAVAKKYGLDLKQFLEDLKAAAVSEVANGDHTDELS
ncbi:MAG: hypothetical protein P8165_06505 [Deltaproteobacteria bacterium]|jgi:hypothetical protein